MHTDAAPFTTRILFVPYFQIDFNGSVPRRPLAMSDILEAFRRIVAGRSEAFEPLAPGLMIAARAPQAASAPMPRAGRIALPSVLDAPTCAALRGAIDRVLDDGMPAVAIYADEALVALGHHVAARTSRVLGRAYVLAEDYWAWKIPRGNSGWPAHRGHALLLDRDAPEWINVWIALDDVEEDRSCMWFVDLDDDPHYPCALDRVTPHDATPVPLAAGDALAWNANVLHWGGACAANARGPRVSCSFSLAREDAVAKLGVRVVGVPNARERVEAVARQIARYGEGQPDVAPAVREWARATSVLSRLSGG